MASSSNSFLRAQRKSELLELAEFVGLKETDGLKKSDLEVALDYYLAEKQQTHGSNPKVAPYYQSRARATSSPVKKEGPVSVEPRRRRATSKAVTQALTAVPAVEATLAQTDEESEAPSTTALTPGPDLSLTERLPLPASPSDVVRVVDQGTIALRERVSTLYKDSGFTEANYNTRDALSTVTSILFCINAFELYHLRKEVLTDRYAFTVPSIGFLGTPDYPVEVPDMFLLLSSSFWNPVLLWTFTSILIPAFFGFYFNLSAAHQSDRRRRVNGYDFVIDPLIFSIAKGIITYIVYQQGVSLGGWVDPTSVARINSAIYGGWKGVLTGAFISGVASFYDAVLRK